MQMMTAPQRPVYKGNPHLRVRPHVGVIALGNAIGNAIVGKMSQPSKEQTQQKVKEDVTKAVKNGATEQEAIKQVADQMIAERGGSIASGHMTMNGGQSLANGMDYSVTNANGDTAYFNLSSVDSVASGYDMIGYLSDHLGSSPGAGMMLGMATNQIIGQTQTYHDNRMNSIQHLDMAKYKMGGANGVFDRPAMVGIPGVTPGPWAPEFLQASSGTNSPAWMRQATGQYGPWSDGYIFASSTPNSSSSDSFTLPSNQINAAGVGVFSLEEMAKRGWGSQLNVARTPMDKINMQLGVGAFAEPIGGARVDTRSFAPLLGGLSEGLTKVSLTASTIGAAQALMNDKDGVDFGDGFRELGKLGVDFAAAAPTLSNVKYLTRFNPVGVAYTAADLAVQLTPDYTIQYGQYAGETRSGWTKLMYMNADQQQRVMNVSPEAHYELYIRRQPKY